jgi:dihydrofolate reductase
LIPIALGPVAVARNGVIGRDGVLPWRLRSDLRIFKEVTLGKPVIMGRRTWDSLPKRPLPGRLNIVLSRDGTFAPFGAVVCEDFEEAVSMAREQAEEDAVEEVCAIGGAEIFRLAAGRARRVYLTEVDADVEGDAFMPPLDLSAFREVRREEVPLSERDEFGFVFRVLERP